MEIKEARTLYTLVVGPEQRKFVIHEDHLRKSPVFAAMCSGCYKEAYEKCITLPEDDPDEFDLIVPHLQGRPFIYPRHNDEERERNVEAAAKLARLYITANKYEMQDFKVAVRNKFPPICEDLDLLEDWIGIAEKIYDVIPRSDDIFPARFRWWIYMYYESRFHKPEALQLLNKWIEKGGRMVVDINTASNQYLREVIILQKDPTVTFDAIVPV
ncbi:MAG: hypothetical protein Q9212_002847 [Teloschistes hypoglaucus]